MNNIIAIKIANLNDLPMAEMINSKHLSQQIISQSKNYDKKRVKQFIACRYLLGLLLKEHDNIDVLPQIQITTNKRPAFTDPNLPDFNISHSCDYVAAAISKNANVGLDIEQQRERANFLTVASQFFSQNENDWLNKNSQKQDAFWHLWTLRESALKLYAKGVFQMKQLKISMPEQSITAPFADDFYIESKKINDLFISVCSNKKITDVHYDFVSNVK